MKHLLFLSLIFIVQNVLAVTEVLVKPDTVSYSGYSAIETDQSIIYGGIAGTPCTGDGASTCNTCIDSSGVNACNQASVYSTMRFAVSFSPTRAVSGIAKLYIESTAGSFALLQSVGTPTTPYTETSVITIETTWGQICLQMGLNASCGSNSGTAGLLASKSLRFGIDSDNSGDVDTATETKNVTITMHVIPAGNTGVVQPLCANNSTGVGACNVTFAPGDEKVYIDSALYNGADTDAATTAGGSVAWESIAVFPIATSTGGEPAVYTSFANGQASPIFKTIDPLTGDIPDSQVSGGLANYQEYCLVYGTKNKTQNIYKFVTSGLDYTKSCVSPSEVAGVLDDKHCFISTAAFGSIDAPEVEIFRQFRNHFMLTNRAGKLFVKAYYKLSPPLANIISGNEYLKAASRMMLYPLLVYAFLSLKIGFMMALGVLLLTLLVLMQGRRLLFSRNVMMVLALLLFSPLLKAEIVPDEMITAQHPQGAQEGLVRIKKDGTYVYDLKKPMKHESSSLTVGQANFPDISVNIDTVDTNGNTTGTQTYNFQDFYNTNSGLILGYNYDWFPYIENGKLGVEAGISGMVVSGHGKLKASPNPDSKESFTFVTMPLTLGGIYRMEWKDKQVLAPYVSGGGAYVLLLEKREDKPAPQAAGAFGFYGTAGVLLNVASLDPDTGYSLDSEYGISNMWISLEFKAIEVQGESFTFSNRYVNAGLSFDF